MKLSFSLVAIFSDDNRVKLLNETKGASESQFAAYGGSETTDLLVRELIEGIHTHLHDGITLSFIMVKRLIVFKVDMAMLLAHLVLVFEVEN